ncbi:hypothetical protein [Pseudoclavibacter terrae]|uniref:hypothetical protein n=1 Tax=Pseudoclavibacter terrae TaxID=1530195 RepID=UPI00232DC2E9|nr:hypothetical protein [Pseudoclavibacter terrae]
MAELIRLGDDVARYIAAFGHPETHAESASLLASLPGPVRRERASGLARTYLGYRQAGVTVIVERAKLDAAIVTLVGGEGFEPYARPAQLIEGIDFATAYKDEVRSVLGEPVRADEYQDNFDVAGAHVVVGYDIDDVWDVQVLARSPLRS